VDELIDLPEIGAMHGSASAEEDHWGRTVEEVYA
jgi:hypothetical protein